MSFNRARARAEILDVMSAQGLRLTEAEVEVLVDAQERLLASLARALGMMLFREFQSALPKIKGLLAVIEAKERWRARARLVRLLRRRVVTLQTAEMIRHKVTSR